MTSHNTDYKTHKRPIKSKNFNKRITEIRASTLCPYEAVLHEYTDDIDCYFKKGSLCKNVMKEKMKCALV
jgi:hypothetical protein